MHTIYHQFTIALVEMVSLHCFHRCRFNWLIHSTHSLSLALSSWFVATQLNVVLQMWQSKREKKSKFNEVQMKLEQQWVECMNNKQCRVVWHFRMRKVKAKICRAHTNKQLSIGSKKGEMIYEIQSIIKKLLRPGDCQLQIECWYINPPV